MQRPSRIDRQRRANLKQNLFVSTSVEYDLPDHIIPPKNAGSILKIDFNKMKQNKKTPPKNSCSFILSQPLVSISNDKSAVKKMENLKRNGSSRSSHSNNHFIPVIDLVSASPALPEAARVNTPSSLRSVDSSTYNSQLPNVCVNTPSSLRIVDSSSYNSQLPYVLRKDSSSRKIVQAAPLSFKQADNDVVDDLLITQTNQLGIQYQEQYKQNKHENNEQRAEFLRMKKLLQDENLELQQSETSQPSPPSYATAMAQNYPNISMTHMHSSNLVKKYQLAESMSPTRSNFEFKSSSTNSKNTASPIKAAQAVFTESSVSNATPLTGAVPPDMAPPHAISTAHIVRARGSPKLKCSKRNAAASASSSLHNYHRQSPRSNTIGYVGLQSSVKTTTQIIPVAMDLSSKSIRNFDEQSAVLPRPQFQHIYRPLAPLMSMEEGENKFVKVKHVAFIQPFIYMKRKRICKYEANPVKLRLST